MKVSSPTGEPPMNQTGVAFLHVIFSLLLLSSSHVFAQSNSQTNTISGGQQQQDIAVPFKPSIAIVIGIFSIMFSLTFLLLMYAKFCNSSSPGPYGNNADNFHPNSLLDINNDQRFSGIDKSIIESLPFFKFSSLKGSKQGLECAVCLSKFEDSEVLRLLPKCKHAFHIDCVDTWLENHSSCPLCRYRVEVEDLTMFKYSNSSRFLFGDPSVRAESELELFVEREVSGHNDNNAGRSSRFSIGGSFRKVAECGRKGQKEESLLPEDGSGQFDLHKYRHKIIVSDVVFKNRWSDLNSADLTSLNSDMLNTVWSRRFSGLDSNSERFTSRNEKAGNMSADDDTISRIKKEMSRKRALESKASQMNGNISASVPTTSGFNNSTSSSIGLEKRCMSEITNLSRFVDPTARSRAEKDENLRRVWLPIARRTVQWFAEREKRSQPQMESEV